ncbi:unnamed protein product [Haemonchus placei]|uniref:Transposase n=1 Tax=Haemonchus placei TaxID=6290 RepID=A0A0N4X386_HAEPC|nr:unnamed protein product [Haemonchus placei]
MPHDLNPLQLYLRNTILSFFIWPRTRGFVGSMAEANKENTPARSTNYKWHSKFATGDYSIEDEDRPGRSMELDVDLLRCQMLVLEADP